MGKRREGTTGITAQNKDVVSKWFSETMKNRSLTVYGIDVPKIVDVRPTNLPAIETNEHRMDNLFLLEDGSYAILDYESEYRVKNKIKYTGYVLRLLRRLQKEGIDITNLRIRIIVIYTADVTREQTKDTLNVGDVVVYTTEGFLSEISSEEVKARIQLKIEKKQSLDDRDLMELIILPLTYKGKETQRKAAHEAVNLAKEIEDESVQEMALAGILSFSDKIIDKKLANEIRRCLSMTKVGAIIAREMEESEARGEARGRASALLTVLASKGEVSEILEQKIQAQKKSEILDQWIRIAATVPDVGSFEQCIMR
ncbi:MAG: hypothetical protein ACI4EC_04380 [Lachnospiraceae bacterium]